jgi:serine/threonine protein kinase
VAQTADEPVPWREAAALVATLADAVQHAHSRGVLHRDLKPANILLQRKTTTDSTDDTDKQIPHLSSSVVPVPSVVVFIPRIADFGLAQFLEDEEGPGRTQSGAVVGTPRYMAPEQASGRSRGVGPAADVYALGSILYELLTGRPPFRGESVLDTLEQVRSCEPVPPGHLRAKLPRDLETICLHGLVKEPARRYARAADLADDLWKYLSGEPIHARPVGAGERAVKWVQRRPLPAANAARPEAAHPYNLALLAMTQHCLGFHEQTGACWERLQEALKQRQWSSDGTAQALQCEAAVLLGRTHP